MAIKVKFDTANNPLPARLILATKAGSMIRELPVNELKFREGLTDGSEFSFSVYKNRCTDENGNIDESFWRKIRDFRLAWCPEFNMWYELHLNLTDSTTTVKTIVAVSLGEAELSQINVYGLEINTESDIQREDYAPTVLFDPDHKDRSLIDRLLYKAPHWRIGHIDDSLRRLQRSFQFDGKSVRDCFTEVSQELDCLFVLEAKVNGETKIDRTVSIYDLETYCPSCGARGEFTSECEKCGNTNLVPGYGSDTSVFVSRDNLAEEIVYETDTDSVKNCFRLEAGDELMTATIVSCNPNGSQYIWYITDEMKDDMSPALRTKLNEYDSLYEQYLNTYAFALPSDRVEQYNAIVDRYRSFKPDLLTMPATIYGSAALMTAYYNTVDLQMLLNSSLMPTPTSSSTSAASEAAKLTALNLSPVAVAKLESCTVSMADAAVLAMAKCIARPTYQVQVNTSSYSAGEHIWTGSFRVTNYSDETDTAVSPETSIRVTDDFARYTQQKMDRIMSQKSDDKTDVVSIFKLSAASFQAEMRKYSLQRLIAFRDVCNAVLDTLIQQGVANAVTWAESEEDLYTTIYLPYRQKMNIVSSEILTRTQELAAVVGLYDEKGGLLADGMQTILLTKRDEIHAILDFEKFLGDTLWKEFASFRREDTFSNTNYISDGLNNEEIFFRAEEFLAVARRELYKSAQLQHSITASMHNLLSMQEFQPIKDSFQVGNWIRVKVDGRVYRLRLNEYTINYDDWSLYVEFTDVKEGYNSASDIENMLSAIRSMSTTYGAVARQAVAGKRGNDKIESWVNDGFKLTTKIVGGAENQEFVIDETGVTGKELIPETGGYKDTQVKLISDGLYVTDDGWLTAKAAVGHFTFYNPQTKEIEESYGVIADKLVGNIVLSQAMGIYTENGSMTLDENGFTMIVDAEDNTKVFSIIRDNGDETYTPIVSIDSNGNLALNAYSTTEDMNEAISSAVLISSEEILTTVAGTLEDYSTTSEVQSAISQRADEIMSTVSGTYVTQDDAMLLYASRENAISDVDVEYNKSSSSTTPPAQNDPNWSTTAPTWEAGKFIWQRTKTTNGNGVISYSSPTCIQGAAATTYSLQVSHAAVVRAENGTYTPSAITLTAKSHTGTDVLSNYAGRFKIETTTDGSTWTSRYTSSSNESAKTYTIPTGIKSLRCRLYRAGGTTTLLDEQTVPVVEDGVIGQDGQDGQDAYTVILTNENHTFAATETAALATNVDCSVIAYKGATQVAATIGTITGCPTGMSYTLSNNGTTTAKFNIAVTTSMTTKNGTLTVPVTVDGHTFNMIFTYSLAIRGASGLTGYNSAVVYLYQRGTSAPTKPSGSLTYTFSTKKLTGTALGSWSQTIPSGDNPVYVIAATAASRSDTDSIASSEWSDAVVLAQNGENGEDGLNSATIILYQRAASAPAKPSTSLTYNFTTGVLSGTGLGSWTQSIPATDGNPCYITHATAISTSTTDTIAASEWSDVVKLVEDGIKGYNSAVVYLYQRATSTPSKPSGSLTYTFSTKTLSGTLGSWSQSIPTGTNPVYVIAATSASRDDTDTIAASEWSDPVILAKNGDKGDNGLNSAMVILYQRAASTPSKPSGSLTYTFSTGKVTGTGLGNWTQSVPTTNGNPCYITHAMAVSSAGSDTIPSSEWSDVVVLVEDGISGYNSAVVYLYQRATSEPSRPSGALTYTFSTKSLSGTLGSWSQTIPDGTDPVYVIAATAASRTDTDSIAANEWSEPVILAQNGENGEDGSNGLNSATIILYQRAASAPAKPSSSLTYNFTTGVLSGTLGNWTQSIPTANGYPCYITHATAISSSTTDTITSSEWSSVVKLVEDGISGYNSAVVYLYQRASSTPSKPSGTLTYTFSTKTLSGTLGSWSQSIPSGTDPVYVTAATAASRTDTDSIAASEWSDAVVLAQNGENGEDGENGLNSATVILYQRASSAPSKPSGSLTYNFTTGVLTGTGLGNWLQYIPASDGNPCYITHATAISTSTSDTIASTEWSDVVKFVEDGIKGYNSAVVYLYQRATSTPSKPGSALTYTFSTKTLSGTLGSWSQSIPSGTDPVYVTAAVSASRTDSDSIAASEWSDPVIMAQNGEDGENGLNSATVILYQRASVTPSKPSGSLTYTFSTGIVTGTGLGNWTQTIPQHNGNPCYITHATAISSSATDTIASSEWSDVVVLVEDGEDGVGISSIKEQYCKSVSNVEPLSTDTWSYEQPEWENGKYIWTRSEITWEDGEVTHTAPVLARVLNDLNEDMYDIGQRVTTAETKINQNTEAIELIASETSGYSVDYSYNLAPYLYGQSSVTVSGVTMSFQKNGTIKLSGTCTSSANLNFNYSGSFSLPAGTYCLMMESTSDFRNGSSYAAWIGTMTVGGTTGIAGLSKIVTGSTCAQASGNIIYYNTLDVTSFSGFGIRFALKQGYSYNATVYYQIVKGSNIRAWMPPKGVSTTMSSMMRITARELTSQVSKDGIISSINQSAESVTINASKINLSGYVTVSSLGASGTTTVNGSRIHGGTLILGGSGNGNGQLFVTNSSSYTIVQADNAGMNIYCPDSSVAFSLISGYGPYKTYSTGGSKGGTKGGNEEIVEEEEVVEEEVVEDPILEANVNGITLYKGTIQGPSIIVGGNGNVNGVLKIKDASNNDIVTGNSSGLTISKGTIQGPSVIVGGQNNTSGTITVKDTFNNVCGVFDRNGLSQVSYLECFQAKIGVAGYPLSSITSHIYDVHLDSTHRYSFGFFYEDTDYGYYPWGGYTSKNSFPKVVMQHDLIVQGDLYVFAQKNRAVRTNDFGVRCLSAYETVSPMFGDIGSGVIDEYGTCRIFLDPIFAETVSTDIQYYVFIQNNGDGTSYISERNSDYFVVKGTPGLSFSWELKARQLGFDQNRLAIMDGTKTYVQSIVDACYDICAADFIENYYKEIDAV